MICENVERKRYASTEHSIKLIKPIDSNKIPEKEVKLPEKAVVTSSEKLKVTV